MIFFLLLKHFCNLKYRSTISGCGNKGRVRAFVDTVYVEQLNMEKKKAIKVAVVGGGVCGICCIKCLKEEGIEGVCFEKTQFSGGTWRYHEDDVEGLASVTSCTVANNSKEMSALSDYPPPTDNPNYLTHKRIYKLIQDYANHFDVLRHMKFNHEVISVRQAEDYDVTGKWIVKVKDLVANKVSTDTYDAVMICSGQFGYPKMPHFPDQEKFKGRILHTKQLKTYESFKNERVVVVGLGCSGVDAATEACTFAEQVYLSSGSGGWILPRLGPYGLPFDMCYLRRWSDFIMRLIPISWTSWYFEGILQRLKFNHSLYGLRPPHSIFAQDPVLSDALPTKIISGHVIVKNNIKTFTENGVIFEGETKVTEADTVIMATGYEWKFPVLQEGIITKDGDCLNLYKCMFPVQLPHPTLAIIGFILPLGPGYPLGEAQCRWASLLISGKVKLPSPKEMMADVRNTYEMNRKRYKISDRLTTRVDYIEYLDDLTSKFGAKPNLLKIFFTDQELFWALWLGPSLPYQYRLQGPHKWPGARKAILTYKERIQAPLRKEGYNKTKRKFQGFPIKLALAFIVFWFWITTLAEISYA
ncbi:flavin-containing monooxygenase 5-like [Stegodyphus dumicola]|uniref:flavin-containing monooxygenase 5-like n=1 Tax=Stegodyphus dumicola TaxID=202533 RepID=UPI0015AAFD29|nr:flavin-containing monooxygenase 5-like [Stegodyphus dumicola]